MADKQHFEKHQTRYTAKDSTSPDPETWLTFASRTLAAVADGSQTSEEAYAWLALLLVVLLAGRVGCALVTQASSPRRKADRATV